MATYYAAVEAFDPAGQDLLPEDAEYGGEARFFVVQAEDLAQTLVVLADTLEAHRARRVPDEASVLAYKRQLTAIDARLRPKELAFSRSLADGAHFMRPMHVRVMRRSATTRP